MKNKIYIVGSGIKTGLHFTEESVQALQRSDIIYTYHHDPFIIKKLYQYNVNVEDLLYLTQEHSAESRVFVYRKIADIVLESAKSGKNTSIVFHGHPLFLVSAAEYIIDDAAVIPIEVKVLSGISSFDAIMTELRHDFAYGMQLFDVTTMYVNRWKPNPKIPTLLFQLASFNENHLVFDIPPQERLSELVEFLSDTYPVNHRCILLYISNNIFEKTEKIYIELGQLATHPKVNLENRSTLYVPEISY